MVEGGIPGQTGAIFHFRPYLPISGGGKGLTEFLQWYTQLTPSTGNVVRVCAVHDAHAWMAQVSVDPLRELRLA